MRKSRSTEEQIIKVLKATRGRRLAMCACRQHGVSDAQVVISLRRNGDLRSRKLKGA